MKKLLTVLVVVSMLFTVAVPVFAGQAVNALSDSKQSEIANLVLNSINQGNNPDTIYGRDCIVAAVVGGIQDFSSYGTDASSIASTVSAAVSAVKSDVSTTDKAFSDTAAAKLNTAITSAIIKMVTPETTSTSTETTTEGETASGNLDYIVKLLSNLSFDKKKSTLVSLVGNDVVTVDEAKAVVNSLYKSRKISSSERDELYAAIGSPEASTGLVDKFFEGYTPTDLSQLFRGFGDSISMITSGLADLFRSAGSSNNSTDNNSTGSNPEDIPATGDYTIASVATVTALASVALILTKKKKDN